MLDPVTCASLSDELKPRISISAFHKLRELIDAQRLLFDRLLVKSRLVSESGGGDASKGVKGPTSANPSVHDPKLVGSTSQGKSGTLSKSVHEDAQHGRSGSEIREE
jgi:hypothetical protein